MPVTVTEMQDSFAPQFHLPLSRVTIHQIKPMPEPTPRGLTREKILHLLSFSDEVVALWIGEHAVMAPTPQIRSLCEAVEARNTQMRKVIDRPERAVTGRPLTRTKNENQLLETFGREPDSMRPFVRVSVRVSR